MLNTYKKIAIFVFRWLSILFFLAAITAPIIGHFSGTFDESYIIESEKRSPNPLPARAEIFEAPKTFIHALELYINDHFGFREKLVRLNSLLRLWLGVSASEKVTIGKNGWFYYSAENIIEQYRGIENFSDKEMDSWIEEATSRKKWFADKKIPYMFVFFPEKTSVYSEFLPDWATRIGPIRRDQIKQRLDRAGIDYVDTTPYLLKAKEKNPVYYKTDSHWNFHGGFVGYIAMMGLVEKYYPGIRHLTIDDLEFGYKESRNQDLAQILNIAGYLKDDNADYYKLRLPSKVVSSEHINNDVNQPLLVKTSVSGAPRLLIIKDSYTDLMAPYLNETFGEILYLPHGDQILDEELIMKFKPDLVISAMVERILRYPMHGIISSKSPYIVDWGPREVHAGEVFFIQPDGSSAMWVKARNVSTSTEIIWGNTILKSSPDEAQGVITAVVPENLYRFSGINSIMLKDNANGLESQKVKIVVSP